MKHQHGLLISVLDGGKPHRGPDQGLGDGFGIGRIMFIGLEGIVKLTGVWQTGQHENQNPQLVPSENSSSIPVDVTCRHAACLVYR
jgi:hypothetical protein